VVAPRGEYRGVSRRGQWVVVAAAVHRLADVMNEPVEELLLVKETVTPYGPSEGTWFLPLWRALDPEDRQMVLDLLRRLRPKN
jgi:hypothetical protein